MGEEIIRLATLNDVDPFHELIKKSFQSIKDLGITWPSTRADHTMIAENIQNNAAYVLEKDGKLISTITIRFPWEGEEPISQYPFVWWFGTDPAYANKGYGNRLLTYVEEVILRGTLKAPAVTLGTSARKHPWLLEMYKRKGYYPCRYQESEDGDLSALLCKILIPELFNEKVLGYSLKQPTFVAGGQV